MSFQGSSRSSTTAGIEAPSVFWRALVSIWFLVGFYVLTLGVAIALFVAPIALAWISGFRQIRMVLLLLGVCWVPAFMLILSMLNVRRPKRFAHGRKIEPHEAPELFAILADLARGADTEGPADVYLVEEATLSVTEIDGRRILTIGAPILAWVTVEELRAGLAHELGHFAFGDTRLLGLVAYVRAAFHGVFEGMTNRHAFADTGVGALEAGYSFGRAIGEGLVRTYAKVYFWFTLRGDRRGELAADELAGRLVGPGAAIRLLEKTATLGVLYDAYGQDMHGAMSFGALPTDVIAGFQAFVHRFDERGIRKMVDDAVRAEKTDPYDTHPATPLRIAALARMPAPLRVEDARLAASLFAIDLDAFLAQAFLDAGSAHLDRDLVVQRMPWAAVPKTVVVPKNLQEARAIAATLFPLFPDATTLARMFDAFVRGLGAGRLLEMTMRIEPQLAEVPPQMRDAVTYEVGAALIVHLFSGALLEAGAEVEPSLGSSGWVYNYRGTRLELQVLADKCFTDPIARTTIERWATALVAGGAPSLVPAEATVRMPALGDRVLLPRAANGTTMGT